MTMNTEAICMPGQDAFEVTNLFSGNRYPAQWFLEWAKGGTSSDSGVTVNGYTALTHCPLWQGVNIIAGDIGQVPIRLVRNEFNEQKQHAAWNLLRVRPNDLQSPSVFKETLMQWALIWGNFVGWIVRRGSTPVDIIPLRPDCLRYELVSFDEGQIKIIHYISPTSGKEFSFLDDEVIHVQGLTGDGVWGYSLFEIAKNTIGHGLALEKHGNLIFSNGAQPSGVLEHPMKLSDEARAKLRADWHSVHGGPDNAGKIAILWEGMKFNPISMTNLESEWLEARKFSKVDAACLLNLPAYKLNSQDHMAAEANLEEQNETYKQMTLTRWSSRMNEEFKRKLLTDKEWKSDEYQFIFDWDAFLRADIDTLTTVADRCVKAQIMNPNEARRTIGLPPYPGGDKFANPAINPKPGEGEEKPDSAKSGQIEPKPPQNRLKTVENAHWELLLDRFQHLLEMESHNLKRAAVKSTNFIRWIDAFYSGVGDGIPPTILTMVDTIMGKSINACLSAGIEARGVRTALISYAAKRHQQILEACSTVTRDELPAAIEKLADSPSTFIAQGLLATALNLEYETNGALYAE